MRLTSVFTCLSVLVAAASALTIPLDVRGFSGDDYDLSTITARDASDVVPLLFERDLEVEDLLERLFDEEDGMIVRDTIYDDILEVRKKGTRKSTPAIAAANRAKPRAAQPQKRKPARVAASKAKSTPNKANRAAQWAAKNKGVNKAKKTARNDAFKAKWAAKNPTKKFKKNQNGKAPKQDFTRKGQKGQKVFWDANARNDLNRLGLKGKERKSVKKFHTNIAKNAMKKHGAASAQIYQLAHKNSSPHDKQMHATGKLFNNKGALIPPAGYTPPPGSPAPRYTHMYAPDRNDPNKLPAAMKAAYLNKNPGKTLNDI